MRHRNYSFLQ